ncbi:MAG: 3-dehydroquinate synthase [Rhodothermales bacterium]|nr:3-dehydroquinate synthase [Rhodothermales bacterium]
MPPENTIIDAAGYPIVFEQLGSLSAHLHALGFGGGDCLVVTDANVASLYAETVHAVLKGAGFTPRTYTIVPGETSKSSDTLQQLYDWAFEAEVTRRTPVIAVGGGVVGDLAGYLAATLLRGLPLIHVPTTLVAQVDSSIGGKTGINHSAGKNLIGSFYRPKLVLSDSSLLDSLSAEEWRSGLSELVKHALIADADLFDSIEASWQHISAAPTDLGNIVRRSAEVKVRTVVADEYEAGTRMLLNFGHTFGHAIERIAGYGTISHGQAVAAGMVAATLLSREYSDRVELSRINSVLKTLLPDSWHHLSGEEVVEAMRFDKKRSTDGLRLILIDRIGSAYVRENVDDAEIITAFERAKAVTSA